MSFSRPCSSAEPSASFDVDKMFDVFLSFRGPDTRQMFARSLYAALCRERILTFLDQEILEKGDHIPTGLSRGITESRICIPIFSIRFAESKWCLREVSLMVKSGVKICPVFYRVSPVDLHCPDGSKYAQDLKSHEREPILEYKEALDTVANIPGWCSSDYSGDNDLIQDVVIEIRKILHSNSPLDVLDVPECFGLDRSVEHVKRLLKAAHPQQKKVKLGICGMSGIGKTTLGKVVCKELFSKFEVFSFVLSVGQRCQEADGLVKLQTQMLKDVSYFRGEVGHVDQGKGLLQECLRGKRVLLLLDDIQSPEQLDALGGNCSDFGAGSRVIITSQDKQILKVAKVDEVYKVRSLPSQHALRLFKFHAFPDSYRPDQELETLCNDIVAACGGLPLALQIFAKLLVGKEDRNLWKEMVGKLRSEPNMQKKLKVSYDALDPNEKEMFQDIACFLTWKKKEIAMIFWAEPIRSPHACLRSLFQKSFVDFGPSNELMMHRCLRDLGRSIAKETPERRRLFDEEDVTDVLCRLGEKAKHVRYLSNKPKKPTTLKAEMLQSLYNLRLLWLTDVAIEGHFPEESSLEDLSWLRLRRYSSNRLPRGMNLQNLVILEVTNSQITHLWDETEENPTMRPGKLKVLVLSGCASLVSLPDTMGSWTSLVSLDMEGCSVFSLPQDFGGLLNLQELNLSCCQHLSKLPTSFGNLSRLQKLEIRHNSKLTELPEGFGGLKSLAFLEMEGCSVSSLPQDIGNLCESGGAESLML
ncbi:disease resistance protein Roq1 [Cryptomeria japonica]|uniref:disease resistance protein Roq1 n=1 Tax=Cryptomeria japonica TaxID=3369 RepID=UPI0027DA35BB|nr:disease resistance protein Roq1 [Cryptomeria japonica]